MLVSRFRLSLLVIPVVLSLFSQADAQSGQLKLIPIPRELTIAATQPLTSGINISCSNPCPAEDSFAIEDLKNTLAAQGIPANPNASSTILVTRYGTSLANSIYTESLPAGTAATEMPEAMKSEGYSIIP